MVSQVARIHQLVPVRYLYLIAYRKHKEGVLLTRVTCGLGCKVTVCSVEHHLETCCVSLKAVSYFSSYWTD